MVSDITKAHIYQRYGVKGLRWFVRIWFSLVCTVLLGLAGTLLWLNAIEAAPSPIVAVAAITLAVGVVTLTRMFIAIRAGMLKIDSCDQNQTC